MIAYGAETSVVPISGDEWAWPLTRDGGRFSGQATLGEEPLRTDPLVESNPNFGAVADATLRLLKSQLSAAMTQLAFRGAQLSAVDQSSRPISSDHLTSLVAQDQAHIQAAFPAGAEALARAEAEYGWSPRDAEMARAVRLFSGDEDVNH